ncbi:MAG: hypothetical protein ACQESX_09400 [Bacteroidota bacterium]
MNEKHKLLPLNINNLILLALSIMALIQSCEYELDNENFIEKEPVPDTHMFEISNTPEGDTIEVFERTDFLFDINTFGLRAREAEISLGDSSWGYYLASSSIEFEINPELFENGYHKLKLKVLTNSGTGTIADQVGAEGYIVEKEWTLLFDNRPAPELLVEKSIDSNRHLTFNWNKCENKNFRHYRVSTNYYPLSKDIIIKDPDSNFYAEPSYIGGDYRITVECVTHNAGSSRAHLSFEEPLPEIISLEGIGFDSVKITWNSSPYNVKYKIESPHEGVHSLNSPSDTSIIIANAGFGVKDIYFLYISPTIDESWIETNNMPTYKIGEYSPVGSYMSYNPIDQLLYAKSNGYFYNLNLNTLDIVNSTIIPNLSYHEISSCATNSSKALAVAEENMYIFNNSSLSNPTIIDYPAGSSSSSVDYVLLTNNDRICYASSPDNRFRVLDIETEQLVANTYIDNYPTDNIWAHFSASQNGDYFCFASTNGLRLFNIGSEQVEEIYSDNRDYQSAYFDPMNPNLLYLSLFNNNQIEVRNAESFSLIKTIDVIENCIIQNIDPVSGLLLIKNTERIQIINPEINEIVFELPAGYNRQKINLYDYILFNDDNDLLDLSEILNK